MKLLSTALTGILLFSGLVAGIALASKDALLSCGGIIGWVLATIVCFFALCIAFTPVLLVLALIDMGLRRLLNR